MKYSWIPFAATWVFLVLFCATESSHAAIIITEIMYDNAGGNEHEYIELYNNGGSAADLTNYTVEDSSGNMSDPLSGSIPAGGTAVVIRIDGTRLHSNYENAWGAAINWIDGTTWPTYTNTGDTVILNDASAAVVASVTYTNTSPWPAPNDSASIYLTDVTADPTDGNNWALSVVGTDGAYQGSSPRALDVGSPGVIPTVIPEPATLALACLGLLAVALSRRDIS
jgi:hypothetical protein